MHIKAIVSATALAVALGFGTAAYAQTMIGDQTVSEADMERVKVHCEDLQNQANQAAGATDAESELTEADDSATDDTASGTDDGDDDTAAVGSIDMDLITVETCLEGGFITAP